MRVQNQNLSNTISKLIFFTNHIVKLNKNII